MREDEKEIRKLAAIEAMKWHGWGSPIGLTVFFIGIAILIVAIRYAVFG